MGPHEIRLHSENFFSIPRALKVNAEQTFPDNVEEYNETFLSGKLLISIQQIFMNSNKEYTSTEKRFPAEMPTIKPV